MSTRFESLLLVYNRNMNIRRAVFRNEMISVEQTKFHMTVDHLS